MRRFVPALLLALTAAVGVAPAVVGVSVPAPGSQPTGVSVSAPSDAPVVLAGKSGRRWS